jgi:hypothetical protein
MIAMKGFVGALAMTTSIAAMGCASQSAAFRQMSAADHENAARAAQGDQAQQHLDAAKRLRDDEQVACYGVPETDRIQGPFARADQIASVEVVRERGEFPKGPLQPVGVTVNLRAEPGMTQQWLGRVVACHMAHLAVVGQHPRPSPLSVANTTVAVSSSPTGFRVTVTSHDRDIARSVVDRGQELAQATYGRLPGAPEVGVAELR